MSDRAGSRTRAMKTGPMMVIGLVGTVGSLLLAAFVEIKLLWLLPFALLFLVLGLARFRMEWAVRRFSRRNPPGPRPERVRPPGWVPPPPLRIAEHVPSANTVAEPGQTSVLFLWVFDTAATLSLLHRVTRLGPVYLLRGGGMLAYDLGEAPRMAFGRIDRFVEETEQEVLDRLARFRVRRTLGYFRQCTMVCTDDVWKFALDRMLERCRVVLVDLSDFVPGRAGISYEIGVLLDRVRLDEIVFVCGPDTDRAALAALLQQVWDSLALDSPNRGDSSAEVRLAVTTSLDVDEQDRDETQRNELAMIVDLIAQAAAADPDKPLPPPRPQPG